MPVSDEDLRYIEDIYILGLGLISIVAQFQIKSCNTMKKFFALFCSQWVTSEAFEEGVRCDQILVPENHLCCSFLHILYLLKETLR